MKEKYLEEIKEIKDIMNRSSRFISLSGISGILAGIIGLIAAFLAHRFVFLEQDLQSIMPTNKELTLLLIISLGSLILALGSAIFFTTRESRKQGHKTWDIQTKRLLTNLLIPLVSGGFVCLILLNQGHIGMIPGMMLIFYGLALINASKYTMEIIRSLGILEVLLGLIAIAYLDSALILWAVGFGVLHIVYGVIIQRKSQS